jgi:hypothetical protein
LLEESEVLRKTRLREAREDFDKEESWKAPAREVKKRKAMPILTGFLSISRPTDQRTFIHVGGEKLPELFT